MKDFFLLALSNLRRRRLRSWLTIIGIFIGIAAIVTFITLGQGLENYINEQFEQMGKDIIMVMGKAGPLTSPMASTISDKPLTEKDLDIIKKIKGVKIASPMLMQATTATYKNEKINLFLYGIEPKDIEPLFGNLKSYQIAEGRNLKENDKYVAIIGNRFHELFKKDIDVGSKLEVKNQEFKIVGKLKLIGNAQDDISIYIPVKIMQELFEKDEISFIYIKTEKEEVKKVAEEIEKELREYRDEKEGEETFSVSTAEQLLETFGAILGVVTAIFIGIAAISLIVGGVGIMNTMYTSVLERTKEIGTMKAIGAKNSDILKLFLIESGLIGLTGGIIGLALGIGFCKAIEFIIVNFYKIVLLKISFNPVIILSILAFSFLVGCLAGTLPALQAAQLKPADALRYE